MASQEFTLDVELPKYGVSEALCPHLIRYLINGDFSYGDPFLRDRDVVEATGRSRSAIRLAFAKLQEEGWIERRGGVGTFVGPRINTVKASKSDSYSTNEDLPDFDAKENDVNQETPNARRLIRLAIIAAGFVQLDYSDWWIAPQIRGMNLAGENCDFSIELLGDHTIDPQELSRRFKTNRPDILVSCGSPLHHAEILGEARRFRIPCFISAVRTPELSMPNIIDNGEDAIADAVQHLYDQGHRRIAYASLMLPHWWTFDRYEGYKKGMRQCGLDHANDLMPLWMPNEANETTAAELKTFIKQKEPTAIIFSSCWAALNMKWITGYNGLHVGEDISVIIYDNSPEAAGWLGGIQPTVIAAPLFEMGQTVARYAKKVLEGQEVPMLTKLSCKLIEGESVKTLR